MPNIPTWQQHRGRQISDVVCTEVPSSKQPTVMESSRLGRLHPRPLRHWPPPLLLEDSRSVTMKWSDQCRSQERSWSRLVSMVVAGWPWVPPCSSLRCKASAARRMGPQVASWPPILARLLLHLHCCLGSLHGGERHYVVSRFALCILKRNNWIVHKARGIQRFFQVLFLKWQSYCFSYHFLRYAKRGVDFCFLLS
jgi:hypothetical protein